MRFSKPKGRCRTVFRTIAEISDGFSDSTKKDHSPHLNLLYLCIVNQFGTRLTALLDMLEQKIGKKNDTAFFFTCEYEGRRLAQERLFIYYSKDGKHKERTYLVWTLKGAEMINKLLKNKKGNE